MTTGTEVYFYKVGGTGTETDQRNNVEARPGEDWAKDHGRNLSDVFIVEVLAFYKKGKSW